MAVLARLFLSLCVALGAKLALGHSVGFETIRQEAVNAMLDSLRNGKRQETPQAAVNAPGRFIPVAEYPPPTESLEAPQKPAS